MVAGIAALLTSALLTLWPAFAPAEDAPDSTFSLLSTRQPLPNLEFAGGDGRSVSLSDFRGRVVLLNVWATWCAPCREEMPMLAELYREHVGSGLQVVGIALDDVAAAREFAAELGIDYPILVGSTDVMVVVRLYGNVSGVLPYSVLIDREGMIRWTRLGVLKEADLRLHLRELLGPG
jgi:thiol-disulfide isomerase/thioredoxin